jgi:arylsulfatase A-like enzyme
MLFSGALLAGSNLMQAAGAGGGASGPAPATGSGTDAAVTARPPNILFLFPDQHRRDWLGTNHDLPLRTPNLDRLAARGVSFTRAYSPSPVCAPARACLASGRSYARCGVRNNHENYPLAQPTYYGALRDAGYRVAGVGKFDLHKDTRDAAAMDWFLDGSRSLREWGFTEGIDNEGKGDAIGSFRAAGRPKGPYMAFLAGRGLIDVHLREHEACRHHGAAYTTALPEDAYCDNWLSDNGLKFLRAFPAGKPWHLVVNFCGPHSPMDVTPAMRERWQDVELPGPHLPDAKADPAVVRACRQNYAAMIENIDRQIGRFLDVVRERGELANTLIVFASDHGEMLGDHGRWGKSIWREPSVGIPLIVAGPGVQQGVVSAALVGLHDLAATFVDVAAAAPLPAMEAQSLRPLLAGHVAKHRSHVVAGLNKWRMVVDDRYKLVIEEELPPRLFDLTQDPQEDRDVAADHPDMVTRLRQALEAETPAQQPADSNNTSN